MRLLLAMIKHETNTFSPIPTDLQRFRDWGLHEGAAVAAAYAGTNHLSLVKTSSALTDVRVQDRRPAEPGAENQGFPRRTRF